MAARSRRRTAWYGFQGALSGSPGTLETTVTDSATVEAPATLIRVIGQLSTTFSRSADPWTADDTQGALMRFGIRTQSSALTAAAEDADLMTDTALGDDRWMWIQQRRWVAETHHMPLFNSSGTLVSTFQSVNTTGPAVVEIPVDIRAKRKWEDPVKLTLHFSWLAIGADEVPFSGDLRWMLRCLYALH